MRQPKYTGAQRRAYLDMLERNGVRWLEIFQGNRQFYSAVYWDLLTRIWRHEVPVKKTEALRFMTAVKSPHTAGKYVRIAIRHGLLLEKSNPRDGRSKLLMLSPGMKARLDAFFDQAITELRKSRRAIDRKGGTRRES